MSSRQLVKHSSAHLQSELQLILNGVVDGLCGADAEGNATFCNDALLEMIGYRAEELVGSNLHELLHPSRGDRTKCLAAECTLRKAIHTRHPIHMAGEFLCRKDGPASRGILVVSPPTSIEPGDARGHFSGCDGA
jgi:PAS domain S-box-containing protein